MGEAYHGRRRDLQGVSTAGVIDTTEAAGAVPAPGALGVGFGSATTDTVHGTVGDASVDGGTSAVRNTAVLAITGYAGAGGA